MAVTSSELVVVAGYMIHRDGLPMWRTTDTSFSDTDLEYATSYEYTVEAYDHSGNFSGLGSPASAYSSLLWSTIAVQD